MRPAPLLASFLFFSVTLLRIADPRLAEAAPPASASSAGSGSASSGSASSGSASSTGKGGKDKAASSTSSTPDAVDPWEGAGPPAAAAGEVTVPPEPPPEPPPDEAPIDPRTAYHKGNAAFREGRFTAARHYYRRALEGDSSFDVLCNLGRAEAELKDNVPAWVHLSRCLELYPRDPELSSTRSSFNTLREEVADRLTPEQRTRAEELLVEARTAPSRPAPAAATAATPAEPAPEVDLGPRSPGVRMAVTLGLGGLALVGVGGGIGFSIYSIELGKQADELRQGIDAGGDNCVDGHPDCDELASKLADSDQAQHIALGSFIAGGALAASAVLTYVLWPHEHGPAKSASGPGPTLGRNLADLRPTGAFDPARGSMWLGLRGRF